MKMELNEDWARIEIRATAIPGPGTLSISTSGQPESFELADENFNLLDPYMPFSVVVDETTNYPIVLYVRPKAGWAADGERIDIVADYQDDMATVTLQDVVAVTATAAPVVNLIIYNAQWSFGTLHIPEAKEETNGAFTVANKNDTDGDGITDNIDPIIKTASVTLSAVLPAGSAFIPAPPANPNPWHGKVISGSTTSYQFAAIRKAGATVISEVVEVDSYDAANQRLVLRAGTTTQNLYGVGDVVFLRGRTEVDLMSIFLVKPANMAANDTVKLEQIGTANIRVWKDPITNPSQVSLPATYNSTDFNGTDILLWVEATDKSSALRDIELRMTYYRNGVAVGSDTVKATAVWAEMTKAIHDKGNTYTIWSDITTPPKDRLDFYGNQFGLRPIDAKGVYNVIAMQYTLTPTGVGAQSGVAFDLTRRKHRGYWYQTGTGSITQNIVPFPLNSEEANDDSNTIDESSAPTAMDHMYVEDAPGLNANVRFADWFIYRGNFEEFVRVRFNGKKPSGNTLQGSRCSDYFKWHVRHKLIPDGAGWKRSTGDATESNENDVGTGHISVGTSP